jgi:hypothetical protein
MDHLPLAMARIAVCGIERELAKRRQSDGFPAK